MSKVIGDPRFITMANDLYSALLNDPSARLTAAQMDELIGAVRAQALALNKTIVIVVVVSQ